jgi:hypothetical protein
VNDGRASVGKTKIAERSPEIRPKDAKKNVETVNVAPLDRECRKKNLRLGSCFPRVN